MTDEKLYELARRISKNADPLPEDLSEHFSRIEKLLHEDQTLVQSFFLQLGSTIPAWLVPGFLKIVGNQARRNDLILTLNAACVVDPNGNGPLWS